MTDHNEAEILRVIETARSITEMDQAVENGFFPLVKRLRPLAQLFCTVGVFRNRKTNKIEEAHAYTGYRQKTGVFSYEDESEWELIIPFHNYYPYNFNLTYAAYLIPPDISVGETVILNDLIEDYYGGTFWDSPIRVDSLKAIWTGDDLSILYEPGVDDVSHCVG